MNKSQRRIALENLLMARIFKKHGFSFPRHLMDDFTSKSIETLLRILHAPTLNFSDYDVGDQCFDLYVEILFSWDPDQFNGIPH